MTTLGIVRIKRCTSRMCRRPPPPWPGFIDTLGSGGDDVGVVAGRVLIARPAADALVAAAVEGSIRAVFGRRSVPGEQDCPDVGVRRA